MYLHKSVTISILKKFTTEELYTLKSFLAFSTKGTKKNILLAYDFIAACAPDFDEKKCTKENLSKAVFKKKLSEKIDKEINRLMSELKVEIEKYIVYQFAITNQNTVHHAHYLWYHSKGLLDEAQKIISKAEQDILHKRNLEPRELYLLYIELNLLQAMSLDDNSTCYYLYKEYMDFCHKKFEIDFSLISTGYENIKSITSKQSEAELYSRAKKDLLKLDFKEELKFFNALLAFIKSPESDNYYYLKNKLSDNNLLISDIDKSKALAILKNKVSRVIPNFENEALDLMKMKFDISKILRNGGAVYYILDEYIEALVDCGKLEAAKAVLAENRQHIIGLKDKNNFCNIYEALILEKEKNYRAALQIANNCYGENKDQRLAVLVMKLRLAYELKENTLLESYINNLRKYLSTNGKNEFNDRLMNYILGAAAVLKKLSKLSEKNKSKLLEIKQKVETDNAIYRKKYLLSKIDEKLLS